MNSCAVNAVQNLSSLVSVNDEAEQRAILTGLLLRQYFPMGWSGMRPWRIAENVMVNANAIAFASYFLLFIMVFILFDEFIGVVVSLTYIYWYISERLTSFLCIFDAYNIFPAKVVLIIFYGGAGFLSLTSIYTLGEM